MSNLVLFSLYFAIYLFRSGIPDIKNTPSDLPATKTPIFSMIFGKGERRRTKRTSNENLLKSTEIAAFWQGSYYFCLVYFTV